MTDVLEKSPYFTIHCDDLQGANFDIVSFKGTEALSAPFSFTVTGRLLKGAINLQKILGKPFGFSLDLGPDTTRTFHGNIAWIKQERSFFTAQQTNRGGTIAQEGPVYTLEIQPLFHLLRHVKDCRIFQNMSVFEIVKQLFQENHVFFSDKTRRFGRKKRDFCVQYNESTFHFISRLLEEEGIFYFFSHTSFQHLCVLGDDPEAFFSTDPNTFSFKRALPETPWLNSVMDFSLKHELVTPAVCLKGFSFLTPDKPLYARTPRFHQALEGETYSYPGHHTSLQEGEEEARKRLQAEELISDMQEGRSTIVSFCPGFCFTLQGHSEATYNRRYALHRVCHHFSPQHTPEHPYHNTFACFFDTTPFVSQETTPKPRIFGTQTALVCGKEGEEIWTEENRRIKVQFHWDRRGEFNEESSCWIRVAGPISGEGWGFLITPRIGQEVVVSFLNGNPDKPLVVGCVYNGLHHPPYTQEEATKSTFKSNSSKNAEGFNEIRFEDLKEKEEVFVHAQKDMNIVVQDNRTTHINRGHCSTVLTQGNRFATLKADSSQHRGDDTLILEKGSHHTTLKALGSHKAHQFTTLHRGNKKTLLHQGSCLLTLQKGHQHTTLSQGNRFVKITGNDTLEIHQGNLEVRVKGGDITIATAGSQKHTVQQNLFFHTGGNIRFQALGSLSLEAQGGVKIQGFGGGVKIQGLTIKLASQTLMSLSAGAFMRIQAALLKLN